VYYDDSGQTPYTDCNYADGSLNTVEQYDFISTVNTISIIVIISTKIYIDYASSYCRITGYIVNSVEYTNETVYCSLFLDISSITVEFSADNSTFFYVLQTVPVQTSSQFSASWNQLESGSFYFR
jgi:hypothetical protein